MKITLFLSRALIIVPIIFVYLWEYSCITNKHGQNFKNNTDTLLMEKIHFDLKIEDILKGNSSVKSISLYFTNNTHNNLILGDPQCWINIRFNLFNNNKEVPMLFKIKLNPECLKNKIFLRPNENIKIVFKNNLNQLFSLIKENNYVLKASYYGIISTDKGSIIKTNETILISTTEFKE